MISYVGIIGAMDEEIELLTNKLAGLKKISGPFTSLPLYTGKLNKQTLVVTRSGIGKVNAALTAQYLIDTFPLQALINTGIAGGLSKQVAIGDLVVSYESLQHDFDAGNFGYPRGSIPRLALSSFPADQRLVAKTMRAAEKIKGIRNIHGGLIVSGDQFVSSLEQKKEISAYFPQALCVEMEGAAIAQVAYLNQVPYVIMRTISDQADQSAPADLNQYLHDILPLLNEVVVGLVNSL